MINGAEMNLLHINCNYAGNPVHKSIVEKLAENPSLNQFVYVPIRTALLRDLNKLQNDNVQYQYSHILNIWDRVFYGRKINKLQADIVEKVNFDYDRIHAHTLFSDGGVAYLLHKNRGVPYSVSVRGTDIYVFLKYLKYLASFGRNILLEAKQIVAISPVLRSKLYSFLDKETIAAIEHKVICIPNPVNDFWVENAGEVRGKPKDVVRLLQIGSLAKGKNHIKVLEFLKKNPDERIHYSIVGSGPTGAFLKRYVTKNSLSDRVSFCGQITDKNRLKEILARSDIFVMPAYNETFGVVYAEAMTQGLPLIYTKNDGVDGAFDKPVGYAVDCGLSEDIGTAVSFILERYSELSANCILESKKLNSTNIAGEYSEVFGI